MFGPYDDDISQLVARGRKRGLEDAHNEKGPLVYRTTSGVYKWRADNSALGLDRHGQDAWAEGYVAGYAKGMNSWENPIATTHRNVLIGAAVLGIGAIAYAMFYSKPAAAATTPPANNGVVPILPPGVSPPYTPPPPNQTATGTNFTDTAFTGNNGQQIAMQVGDTVSVDLPVPAGATSFNYSATGTALQGGVPLADSTQYMQVWTAGATGTSTVSFQATDIASNAIGAPVSFTATVS